MSYSKTVTETESCPGKVRDCTEVEEEIVCSQLSPSHNSTLPLVSDRQVDEDIQFRYSQLPVTSFRSSSVDMLAGTVSRSRSSAVAGRSVAVQSESISSRVRFVNPTDGASACKEAATWSERSTERSRRRHRRGVAADQGGESRHSSRSGSSSTSLSLPRLRRHHRRRRRGRSRGSSSRRGSPSDRSKHGSSRRLFGVNAADQRTVSAVVSW